MIAVLPMRWWHLEEVHALEADLFPDDPWTAEQLWQELAQETRAYVVAVMDDRVVGYAGAFVLPPDSDVQTIAVAAAAQGNGLGARLLTTLMTTAARGGLHAHDAGGAR